MDDEAFQRICIDGGKLVPLETVTERRRHADDFRELAATQLRAAKHLLGTDADQMVVGHAYGAMEAKANELLAWNGYRSKSHLCTQIALSRLLERKDLARPLSRAYDDRQVYEYTSDPRDMTSAESFDELVEIAAAYCQDIEAIVRELRK